MYQMILIAPKLTVFLQKKVAKMQYIVHQMILMAPMRDCIFEGMSTGSIVHQNRYCRKFTHVLHCTQLPGRWPQAPTRDFFVQKKSVLFSKVFEMSKNLKAMCPSCQISFVKVSPRARLQKYHPNRPDAAH